MWLLLCRMRHSHAGSSARSRALTASTFRPLKCSWCPIREQHPQLDLLKPVYWAPAVFLLSLQNQQFPVRVAKALRVGVGGVNLAGEHFKGPRQPSSGALSQLGLRSLWTLCQKGQ